MTYCMSMFSFQQVNSFSFKLFVLQSVGVWLWTIELRPVRMLQTSTNWSCVIAIWSISSVEGLLPSVMLLRISHKLINLSFAMVILAFDLTTLARSGNKCSVVTGTSMEVESTILTCFLACLRMYFTVLLDSLHNLYNVKWIIVFRKKIAWICSSRNEAMAVAEFLSNLTTYFAPIETFHDLQLGEQLTK